MPEEVAVLPKLEPKIIEKIIPYDLIIIGGGPAGLTAGLYAARSRLKTLLIEKAILGGELGTIDFVENYPGFPDGISGYELSRKIEEQAKNFELKIQFGEATEIKNGKVKGVIVEGRELKARAIIIATGTEPKKLDVPGEEFFRGRGISYCATCDAPFYKGKKVVVVGGGNSAIEEALYLTKFAELVTVIHRKESLRADKVLEERARGNSKIYFIWNTEVSEISGKEKVEEITVRDIQTNKMKKLPIDGIFIYIGFTPNTKFLKDFVKLDKDGYIITDPEMKTSKEGVFASGDVRAKSLRQVSTAISDGAIAANSARLYIEGLK